MKRWAVLTVALYGFALLVLTVPTLMVGALQFPRGAEGWTLDPSLSEAIKLFAHWGYWLWMGVMLAGQATLLLVPVGIAERRPPGRRRLLVPVVVTSFLLGNLMLAGLFAGLSAGFGDDASRVVEFPAGLAEETAFSIPPIRAALAALQIIPGSSLFEFATLGGMMTVFWLAWALIFFHFGQADEPTTLLQRATRWLLRGSVLELLIAIPSHVIVRHRHDCCAPFATFWGIATGISVMLLSFGPGVFFLFAARMNALHPRGSDGGGPHPRHTPNGTGMEGSAGTGSSKP